MNLNDYKEEMLIATGLGHAIETSKATSILTRALNELGEKVMEAVEQPVVNKKYKDLQRPTADQCCDGVKQALTAFGLNDGDEGK